MSQPLLNWMPEKARGALYEFLIPTFPPSWLAEERVAEYGSHLGAGMAPTAVALSVLDVKQPATWEGEPRITSHWCLAHYLLDGHHKALAASQAGRPLTLLSFLAVDQGVTEFEEAEEIVNLLERSNLG